ncbi:hypothetical protein ACWOEH_05270 [Enterococcus nangangensis]
MTEEKEQKIKARLPIITKVLTEANSYPSSTFSVPKFAEFIALRTTELPLYEVLTVAHLTLVAVDSWHIAEDSQQLTEQAVLDCMDTARQFAGEILLAGVAG